MYRIIESEKNEQEGGLITHTVDMGKQLPEKIIYSNIQGGLSWPNQASPGYYVILGQLHHTSPDYGNRPSRSPLKFLAEGQNEFIEELFGQLTDDAKMLLCEDFFCAKAPDEAHNPKDEWQGYVESFDEYLDDREIGGVYLRAAPYIKNFQFGAAKIREWIRANALEIPKSSIVYSQLKRMTTVDLRNDPEINFHAVNALRYVVGDFDKHETGMPFIRKPRQKGRLAWMAR